MGRLCPICYKTVQNIWSHLSRVHKIDGPDRKFWLEQEHMQKGAGQQPTPQLVESVEADHCSSFQLLHPFTAIVAGMTGSGKTVWVQNLLQHAFQVIKPQPQRIV